MKRCARVLKYLKDEKGFKQVKEHKDEQLVVVSLPKMDIERKFELSDFLEQKYRQFHKILWVSKARPISNLKSVWSANILMDQMPQLQ